MDIYRDFVRANSNYLSRSDEAGLDITGELTFGTWVYFDSQSTNAETGILSKWFTNQYAYVLYKSATNVFTLSVSTDGSTIVSVNDMGANYIVDQWFYVVGRFTPSTELALFVNGMWYKSTVGIPATIFNSSEDFEVGRYNRDNYLDGKISHAFICAYSIPDRFICAMFSHARAMYMLWGKYPSLCSSSSSTTITSSSSSSSTTTSSSSSGSSESYSSSTSTSTSTSSSTTCSSSSSTITSTSSSSSSSTTSSSSSSAPP